MNKVFLSGRIDSTPRVEFTPKGNRMLSFSLHVEEGDLTVEIIALGENAPPDLPRSAGGRVAVSGTLVRAKLRSHDVLKVKASKIFWTEE